MAYTYEPLSELEAVNLMLATVGSSPVSSLASTSDLQVSMALQFLYDVSREVQTVGYHFNTEPNYLLALTTSNEVNVPPNALSLDVSDKDSYKFDVVVRGTRLYDLKTHSYTFPSAVTVDLTVFLPFTEIPQAARQYIAIVAARRFQRRVQGDDAIEKYTAIEESMAKAQLEDYDAHTRDYNLGDSFDVFQIISR